MIPLSRFAGIALVIAFAGTTISAFNCPGGSGCLDLSFANAGFVSATVNNGVAAGWAVALEIQPDDKIVVAVDSGNVENPSTGDFYVLRFNADGTPDTSFGVAGVSRFAFTTTADNESAWSLALQADGKILVAGTAGGNPYACGLARLNTGGSLDSTFGSGGKVTFRFGNNEVCRPTALRVQADGKIVAAGNSATAKFGFARFNANGTLDTTFNASGRFTASVGSTGGLHDLKIQPDGKLIASGTSSGSFGRSPAWTLMRVKPNGGLDTTFGAGGTVKTPFTGNAPIARNVVVLPDGKILSGGDWIMAWQTYAYVFIRYHANGQIDTGFGNSGKAIFSTAAARKTEGMIVQSDGKIVGAGYDQGYGNSNTSIFRLQPNGALDPSFGNGGITHTDYNGKNDEGYAMGVQSDGRFVVAGIINSGSGSIGYIGLYRYLP